MQKQVISNAKWIIFCKVGQALLQMIVGVLTARYLGPSNYGLINYAASVVAFVLPFVQLGIPSTLVQELIDMPEHEGEVMGTAIVMNVISGLAGLLVTISFVAIANQGERITLIVSVLYSFSLLFRALELMNYWFQYKLKSKYPSIIMLGVSIIVSIYKICILIYEKSIYWFAIVSTIEFALSGFAMVAVYSYHKFQKFKFSFKIAKKLFLRSRYYIMAAAMVTIFQNTDHIMLKMMSGDRQNGFYTAAITCATIFHFLYFAIIDSVRPIILLSKKNDSPEYKKNISDLYCITVYLALLQAIGFTVLAKPIVIGLFGEEYAEAAQVLRIIIWQIGFSHMGTVRNIWILAEGKERLVWRINLIGALLNVILNAWLISLLGAIGAASASLATQVFTNFGLTIMLKELGGIKEVLLEGIKPQYVFAMMKNTLKSEIFRKMMKSK